MTAMRDKIDAALQARARLVRPGVSWQAPTMASVRSAIASRRRGGPRASLSTAERIALARAQRSALADVARD
jgi:hypothetical protein